MSTRAHRSKFIDRLFVLLQVTYGHLWSSLFVSDELMLIAHAQWSITLAPYSETAIERAMDRCKRLYQKPPTLAQFLDILRTDGEATAAHREYQALPKPDCDKGKAQAEIAAMRSLLRTGSRG